MSQGRSAIAALALVGAVLIPAAPAAAATNAAPLSFGANDTGQLGDGTFAGPKKTPAPVKGELSVIQLEAGHGHSLVLAADGTVRTFGANGNGQLGDGTHTNKPKPVKVLNLTGVKKIAAMHYGGMALKNDGTLWDWGLNQSGQLGNGTQSADSATPVQVAGLTTVVDMAGGRDHGIAVLADGTVRTWGSNSKGQLGIGAASATLAKTPVVVPGLTGVVAVAAGREHNLVLKSDGTVWGWGDNPYGQIGDGFTTQRPAPVLVPALSGKGVKELDAGAYHSMALTTAGTVWAWGNNQYGQLGDTTVTQRPTPFQIPNLTGVASLALGRNDALALMTDKTVKAWGWNLYGQLGDGTTTDRHVPTLIPNLTKVTYVAAGRDQSIVAVTRSNDVQVTALTAGAAHPNTNLTYTITVRNAGPDPAVWATLSLPVPAGANFQAATATTGTLTKPAVGATGTVVLRLANLAVGATVTMTVTVKVTAAKGATLNAKATSAASPADAVPANNTRSLATAVS